MLPRLSFKLPRSFISQWRLTRDLSTGQHSAGKKLDGRVAIVTASTDGIGFSVAKRLIEDGSKVIVSSRKKDNVDKAVSTLGAQYPGQVAGIVCHVGSDDDQKRLIDFTLDKFGSIDMLVSNAAVNPYFGSFIDMDESQWDKIFDINVKAPFRLTQKVVPQMLKNERPKSDKGSVVYVSSIAAYSGMGSIGAYSVSKTALLGLCKNMSMDLAPNGIRVNLVAPGVIKTRFSQLIWESEGANDAYISQTHMKRLGEADEIAGAVSFLCGPDASYITGESLVISGGYHCKI